MIMENKKYSNLYHLNIYKHIVRPSLTVVTVNPNSGGLLGFWMFISMGG